MHEFGTMDDSERDATDCSSRFLTISEEILYFAIYADSNDVEGIRFIPESGDRNAINIKANYPIFKPDPEYKLPGRPIGFRI